MPRQDPTAIWPSDIAVDLQGVTKTFEQWQRSGQLKDIVKNLLRPEKKVIKALDDISFQIREGEFVAYAGPNGAGKSTTMKLLCGMLLPASGEIRVLAMSPHSHRVALMRRVGVLFGNRTELWWDHPVASSFEWKRVVWDIPMDSFLKAREMVVDLLDIGSILHTFARELSMGQRMRADLALMLLHNPELILLDEPTLGLDVLAKRQMISFLKKLNKEKKTTVIVTSHDMDDLEEMADRILLISDGQLSFDGSFDDLRKVGGGMCHISLTIAGDHIPQLSCGTRIANGSGIWTFEVDTNLISIQSILAEIAYIPEVVDIETKKAPIEKIIADIYTSYIKGARLA